MWTECEYPQDPFPVDNSCGKICGQCGKLWVINRYFASLEFIPILWIGWIRLCIFPEEVGERTCYVTAAQIKCSDKTGRKSLQIVKNRCQFLLPFSTSPDFFVKNRQKTFWVSEMRGWEYFPYPVLTVENKQVVIPSQCAHWRGNPPGYQKC